MKVLGIDSSCKVGSCAIISNNELIGNFFINTGFTHSQTIMGLIDGVLKTTGITLNDIDLISISNGPGSFTGLRIGASITKGLAMGKNINCIGVSTLKAMCNNFDSDHLVISTINAGHDCIYVHIGYKTSDYGNIITVIDDCEMNISDVCAKINELYDEYIFEKNVVKDIIIVGDGANLCYNNINKDKERIKIAYENVLHSSAYSIALLGKNIFENSVENVQKQMTYNNLELSYLKLSQAQREMQEKLKNKGE